MNRSDLAKAKLITNKRYINNWIIDFYWKIKINSKILKEKKITIKSPIFGANLTPSIDDAFLSNAGDVGTGSYDFTGAEMLGASPLQFEGTTNDNVYTTLAFNL